jgi:hypothetical protein
MGEWRIDDGYGHLRRKWGEEPKPAARKSTAYKRTWCNVFGGENAGPSDVRHLGGLGRAPDKKGDTNWFCDTVSVGRFYMECAHGHRGQPMDLCAKHVEKYGNGTVKFCPRCNTDPPGHRCELKIIHAS